MIHLQYQINSSGSTFVLAIGHCTAARGTMGLYSMHTGHVNVLTPPKIVQQDLVLTQGQRKTVWLKQIFLVSDILNHLFEQNALLAFSGGGFQLHEDKNHHVPTARNRSSNTSSYYVLVLMSPRKTTQPSTGWNNSLFTWKRDSKISLDSGHQSPMVRGPLRQLLAFLSPFHTAVQGLCPLPMEDRYSTRVDQVAYVAQA